MKQQDESHARTFIEARDALLSWREDFETAQREFRWPRLSTFNWASDYFDAIAAGNEQTALRILDDCGGDQALSFAELSLRSAQVANLLSLQGVGKGDRVLIVLGNVAALWETMLAAMKIGAVIIPATTLLDRNDLQDRVERGGVKAIVTHARLAERFHGVVGASVRICVDEPVSGWIDFARSHELPNQFTPTVATRSADLLFLYFTSGTTARPKLVAHTHVSYPVGHLSTMYWLGLRPGDVHLNLSSSGWAKHAWSCFFAPWNAQACVLAYNYERFDPRALLDLLVKQRVTTFCAPPTVWRMLIQCELSQWQVRLRELASAGEPLNPEVIQQVRDAWGLTIRDGFGQTETTAQVGNPPGQALKAGSMGRPLPGCPVVLVDAEGRAGKEGEICIDLSQQPLALMTGYLDDSARTEDAMRDGYYHTGDVATQDEDGYITYVGRMDDVFKSSDYRISPFELESVLIEHAAVAEAAVVPSPDALRLAVPKAFVVLAVGYAPDLDTARSILQHVRDRVSPFKRIRRLEFAPLPKTISGKIRRVELRTSEHSRLDTTRRTLEFWEEDLVLTAEAGKGTTAAPG
jgi:acetyl-CoA synthetase